MKTSRDIQDLLAIMARLRTPGSGCPWDLEQDFHSIAPYTLEEAYEVADAIEREDFDDLPDELGDLLLQVVFHARMGEEGGLFDFGDVVERISEKLVRRHPHVFADAHAENSREVLQTWAQIKAQEKDQRAQTRGEQKHEPSFFDDVPVALPALTRAVKLQSRASKVGFDWNDARKVIEKLHEELRETEEALDSGDRDEIEAEIGDMFFALANLARHLDIDPEQATRAANQKFVRRFAFIERGLAESGRSLESADLTEMDALWNEAKATEAR